MKRKGLTLILLLVLSFSAAATLNFGNAGVTDSVVYDWPMFRYDAANSGTPDDIAPVTHDLLWTTDLLMDKDALSLGGSSPAIVDGVVYIGSNNGYMHALDASSGITLWSRALGSFKASSPAVVGGVVYVRFWEGIDYALNASTGAVIWKSSRGGYSDSSPAVVNGVYFARSTDSVTALNALTGSVIWNSVLRGNGEGSPIVVDDTIFISESGYMYALDARTGAVKWTCDLQFKSNTDNAPAVVNGIVYIASGSSIFYALDAETGEPIWNYTTGRGPHSNAVVSNGIVYVGSQSHGFFALDAVTGAEIWTYPTSPGLYSSVAVAGGNVYLAGKDGNMYALDAATGAKLWSYAMSNVGASSAPATLPPTVILYRSSSPSVANGVLYIRNSNGYLCAFGKATRSSISLFPAFGLAGTITTVSGSGFTADSTVTATFDGAPITLSNSSVDSLGHLSATVAIPYCTPGTYPICVIDASGSSASANFTVVSAPTTSWPMFMHDLQHSGTPDNIAPVSNSLLWKFNVAVTSSAAVVGGIVYYASQNSYVYALDAYTGACYWLFNLGSGTLSSPAVVNGVVYIGSDDGVYAINAYTGAKIWQSSPDISTLSSPAVSGEMVYVGSFVERSVYAFRVSDGKQVWEFNAGDHVNSSPAVADNVVYICSDDGYLYALNAATGALIWKFFCIENYSGTVSSSPVVANGVVYVTSSEGNLFAIDASTGNKIWSHLTADLGSFTSSPVYCNGIVYTSTVSGVYALKASNGEERWHSTPFFAQASPAVVAGVIYVGASDGNIYALSAITGAKLWQYETGSFIRGQTSIANGVIYVGTGDGTYAIGTPQPSPEPMPSPSPNPSPSPPSTPTAPSPSLTPDPSPTPTPENNTVYISIFLPQNNGKYFSSNVNLGFTVSEPVDFLGYSLDGQENVSVKGNVTLSGLSDGMHTLTVYANDAYGFTGASETVTFKLETEAAPPSGSQLAPFPTVWASVFVIASASIISFGLVAYFVRVKRRKKA
jgi:outer membrane protein assembly factor BamB